MSRKDNFKLYRVWDGIVQRCYNPKAKNYHNNFYCKYGELRSAENERYY